MVRLLGCSACRKKVSEVASVCPSCGHPLGQDPKFQAGRRPRRLSTALVGALLLALGLGALIKPPAPTPGPPGTRIGTKPLNTPVPTAPAAQPASPDPGAVGFPGPNKIAACLAQLGFTTGTVQQVPLGLWQAVSPKQLFHGDYGDINLFVSGSSSTLASVVELEANARADGWKAARADLLRALPVLLKHLQLPTCVELVQSIEGDSGEQPRKVDFTIGDAKAQYATKPNDDLRSASIRLTRE